MNERIKELMAEARLPFSKTGSYFTQELLLEKFAELIVKECATVAYETSYHERALIVSNKIKQHFGVEE